MSIKSQNVKTFINQVGVEKQLFVFVGSDTNNTTSDSTQTEIDIWNNSDFSLRVGQNSVCGVIENHKWVEKRSYIPWGSNIVNSQNFYAYNDQNGYVYLCISDNIKNKITQTKNISNIKPSHISGLQTYDDGYTWLPLYKITASHERFVTSKWIPVISFETFDSSNQQTQLEKTQAFCSNDTSQVGNCAIYANQALSTDDDFGTIEYQKGDLFTIAEKLSCSDCHYLMYNNDKFISVFYETDASIPQNITILDTYDEIGTLIQNNTISTASPYYYLYNLNENDGLDEGCVVSCFIDITTLTTDQLKTTIENPELTITSNTGSGASIRLLTSLYENTNIIDGIEIVSKGSGYKDINLSLSDSYLTGLSGSSIVDKIIVNLDKIDHLGFDPLSVLNCQHVMIDARVEKQSLTDAGIAIPATINFFGLLENPIGLSGSTEVVSGTELNKKIDSIYRTTVKVEVSAELETPDDQQIYEINLADELLSNVKINTISDQEIELKQIPYSKISSLVGSNLSNSTSNYEIQNVIDEPSFVKYSGTVLSTTKYNTNLPISDVDSVIIRINMVRGM